jgi:hypothetical protein
MVCRGEKRKEQNGRWWVAIFINSKLKYSHEDGLYDGGGKI